MKRLIATALLLATVPAYAQLPDATTKIKISATETGPADLTMTGPATSGTGQVVSIIVSGLPAVDLSKTVGEQTKWIDNIRFDVSEPTGSSVTLDKELSMSVSPWEWRLKVTFLPKVNGCYIVVCDWNEPPFGLALHRVEVGGGTVPPPLDPPSDPPPNVPSNPPQNPPQSKTPNRVTYVYEKDSSLVPPGVAAALAKLNKQSIDAGGSLVASELEEDTVDGSGQVPDQYKEALQAAKNVGLPALVIEYPTGAPKTIKNPKTEAEVLEACK